MNFIIGESHIAHMFDRSDQTIISADLHMIANSSWRGYCWTYGKTFKGAIKTFASLFRRQDMSKYENCFFLLGTNDILIKTIDLENPIKDYVAFVNSMSEMYGFKRTFILTPFYFNQKCDLIETFSANLQVGIIKKLLVNEGLNYPNIHILDITDIFSKDDQLFHDDYSKEDGIHFNDIGKDMFFNRINEAIDNTPPI